jgi:Sigma-70 region 2
MPMTTEPSARFAVELEGNLRQATDELLTLEAKSGNGSAFVELSRRYSKRIHLHVYRILGNWEDAEDVLQDSLLKAFKHLDQFRERAVSQPGSQGLQSFWRSCRCGRDECA